MCCSLHMGRCHGAMAGDGEARSCEYVQYAGLPVMTATTVGCSRHATDDLIHLAAPGAGKAWHRHPSHDKRQMEKNRGICAHCVKLRRCGCSLYYGYKRGVTWLNAVNDQVAGIGAMVVRCTPRDSLYTLDTLLNLDGGVKPGDGRDRQRLVLRHGVSACTRCSASASPRASATRGRPADARRGPGGGSQLGSVRRVA